MCWGHQTTAGLTERCHQSHFVLLQWSVCQPQVLALGWVTSPGTARSSCPALTSEGSATVFKSFPRDLLSASPRSSQVQSPHSHGLVALAGQNLQPHQAPTAVPTALSSCSCEGLELLTKVLCTETPICSLLEPIYALNSTWNNPKPYCCLSSSAASLSTPNPKGSAALSELHLSEQMPPVLFHWLLGFILEDLSSSGREDFVFRPC